LSLSSWLICGNDVAGLLDFVSVPPVGGLAQCRYNCDLNSHSNTTARLETGVRHVEEKPSPSIVTSIRPLFACCQLDCFGCFTRYCRLSQ
jgi:hypothetical protein